jgi:hypothetical protein
MLCLDMRFGGGFGPRFRDSGRSREFACGIVFGFGFLCVGPGLEFLAFVFTHCALPSLSSSLLRVEIFSSTRRGAASGKGSRMLLTEVLLHV